MYDLGWAKYEREQKAKQNRLNKEYEKTTKSYFSKQLQNQDSVYENGLGQIKYAVKL